MQVKSSQFMVFNDGICDIYRVDNGAEPGDRPAQKLKYKYNLRFAWHVVGIARYYEAMQQQATITRAIDVPLLDDINSQDVVIIGDRQYRIEQVQQKHDTRPPTCVLSLSDIEEAFEV